MCRHRNTYVRFLPLLVLGALLGADAAAGTAMRSAAASARSSRSRKEAGQMFGININFGGSSSSQAAASAAPAPSQTTTTSLFPGFLGTLAGAVLGIRPTFEQQPQQQQQEPPAQAAPTKPAGQKQQTPASPKPKQPKQHQPKPSPKPTTTSKPDGKKQPKPLSSQPHSTQQPQRQQQKQQPPPMTSSLIASGPPLPQQQQGEPHKVYYKKKKPQQPKVKLPVVASAPSYVPQHPAGTVPMCEWRSDFNECQVHRHYYLGLEEKPHSYIAKTIAAASARDYACAAHTQPSACQESSQGLRCGWNLSGGRAWDNSGCRSYYMAEWTVFSFLINAGVGAAQAAVGLTHLGAFSCPGSLAARALSCNTAYPMDRTGNYDPNMCAAATPGCIFAQSQNNCVMSPELTAQLSMLKPEDVGTCSAACYLRVLDACPAKPQRNDAGLTDPSSCWASPGCTWSNGVCGPDIYSSQLDAWGRQVAAAAEACSREKEAWGCGQAGAKGLLQLPSAAVQLALQEGLPGSGQEDAHCPL